ncbi:helix-turn-helix transcriptional regulator [Streptacidiphilus sp. ASG 303]|uniref:helix-turn-helix transcriptional regulator n=1 Tax=Streptacidiphilus sp. ASG 303 TaxID=2896847 RepID=UPI001E5E1523|nr:helix-turn-helix transcriptional regulator [Streptacidiphilus sp. ASG 303]MCD0482348.1 helix-turn-helix transcriptional regulator [Streptacidiphilus sp. ASG 303]
MTTAATAPPASPPTAAPGDRVRRRELASFLRSRRERITPEQVGLPSGGRRRTPGLRREEVAQLSAVGVTWYTWLEQARDIQVSAQVLDAVARTLMLDPNERAHLFLLAGTVDPSPDRTCAYLTPALREMIARLEPLPACVINGRYDILAYNRTYARLVDDLDALPAEDRNGLWLAFTHPAWRQAMVDRDAALASMVARYRATMANHVAEPAWKALVKRLRAASPEFAAAWERHEVAQPDAGGSKRFLNPHVGLLAFDFTHLWLSPRMGTRLITYTPVDDATRARLDRLHALSLESG